MTICVLRFQTYFQTTIRRGLLHVCCHPHHTNGDFCFNHAINIVNTVPFPNHLALYMQVSSYLISNESNKSNEIRPQSSKVPGIRLFVPGKTRELLSFLPKFPSFSEKKYLTNKKRLGTQLPGSNSS